VTGAEVRAAAPPDRDDPLEPESRLVAGDPDAVPVAGDRSGPVAVDPPDSVAGVRGVEAAAGGAGVAPPPPVSVSVTVARVSAIGHHPSTRPGQAQRRPGPQDSAPLGVFGLIAPDDRA
jgi:hypothetical protein